RAHLIGSRKRLLLGREWSMFVNAERDCHVVAVYGSGVTRSGNSRDPSEQFLIEAGDLIELFVSRARRIDLRGQDALRLVAQINVGQTPEALDRQPASYQNHHRQRDLDYDQRLAKPAALPSRSSAFF